MSNFMGPMAPPQAAPSQPPQLDIRTNPNQRERFREFMRQNTRPNLAVPAMQPPMMPQAPMPMAPQAPRPPIPMAIRPNAPMPAQPAPMPYGGNIDVFSPQYMNQPRPMYLEDGGDVPMPTVVPNSKQKDVMLRIAYDEALRKGAVENALRQLETDRVIERSKEMELDRIRDIERQDRLDDVKRMRLEAELADRNYRLKGLLTPPDQGLEDDPLFALPIKREDGGSVPPRRTEIRGQDHMLAYITPKEAGILTALGGSGEAGPMGIPSYPDYGGDDGFGGSGGGEAATGGSDGGNADGGSDSGRSGPGDMGAQDSFDSGYSSPTGYGKSDDSTTGRLEDADARVAAEQAAKDAKAAQDARDLVAKTFALDSKGNPVGAPNSKTGFATTGKPSQDQINDALAAAKSLGIDISGSQTATDLGLNDPDTTAVEAVTSPTAKTSIQSFADLTDLLSAYQTTETPAQQAAKAKAAEQAQLTGLFGMSSQTPSTGLTPGFTTEDAELMATPTAISGLGVDALADSILGSSFADSPPGSRQANTETSLSNLGVSDDLLGLSSRPSTQTVDDPMAVARAMDQISPKGLLDAGLFNAAADLISDVFGLTPDPETVRSDYENRAYSSLGMSPGLASAVLGTQTATGPVTGAIGGPRGFLGSLAFGPYSSGAAGMTGMTPDGKSTGAITGDQLADLATRNRSGILGGISGFFNDMTRSAASKSNVAVVDPATGKIVGAIDGKGRYTGNPKFNPNPRDNFEDRGGGQPYIPPYIPPVVEPVVDDGTPNIFGGMGDDSPYQPLVQNYTGDGREQYAGTLRMPVGYGDPRTGYIAPQAFTTAGFTPPPRGPIPIGFFEDGGEVLDQAAGRFLEALTAA